MAQDLRSVRTNAPQIRGAWQKGLLFLKEWGGIATLLIAILYTFPFQLFDRYTTWSGESVKRSREILVTSAQLYAEKVKTISSIDSSQTENLFAKDFIAKMYDMRIYNMIVPNINSIRESARRLSTSEIYAFGSLLSMNGRVGDGLTFYELATKNESDPALLSAIYREKGNALSIPGPSQDPKLSHEAYLKSLSYMADDPTPAARIAYVNTLGELIYVEYSFGMLACANFHRSYYYGLIQWAASDKPMSIALQPGIQMFERVAGAIPYVPAPATLCEQRVKWLAKAPIPA